MMKMGSRLLLETIPLYIIGNIYNIHHIIYINLSQLPTVFVFYTFTHTSVDYLNDVVCLFMSVSQRSLPVEPVDDAAMMMRAQCDSG